MAKSNAKTGGGNSKIRFIMLEADLADGDLTQITQAITQAVRHGQPVARQLTALTATTPGRPSTQAMDPAAPEADDADEVVTEPNESGGEPAGAAKARSPRRPSSPKVLSDVDLNSGDVPFEKFANEKAPKATLSRYLIVAYWFKTHRKVDAVTAHHVYTCYKKMGWGTDIKNFSQALRDNARQGRGDMKNGAFAINHIGEAAVEKMTPE